MASDQASLNYNEFINIFMKYLHKYAPLKTKFIMGNNAPFIMGNNAPFIMGNNAPFIMGNNAPFMNKTLSKAFVRRAKLRNSYNKSPTVENNLLYKKQRNYLL